MSELLNEAWRICRRANLNISTRRNSAGELIEHQVYRSTPTRPVFVGKCRDDKALLDLVRRAA